MRILFAEDEPMLREFVTRGLTEAGHAVDAVETGTDALLAAKVVEYDVAILDVNLPERDGFDVCREMRSRSSIEPAILFLTARDSVEDRVRGLDLGAEDYLVKPFAFAELLARIRVLLRRSKGGAAKLKMGYVELDPSNRTVSNAGDAVHLTAKEFALLEYLVRNAGRVVTKTMIAEHVWNFDLDAESNFIEVYIYSIRKKLGLSRDTQLIHTVRGVGYRVDAPATA